MDEGLQGNRVSRLGLVATDEVRIEGLRALLEAAEAQPRYELVLLAEPGALDAERLNLALIDAGSTDHLFELLATFRRLRPRIRLVVISGESDVEFIERTIEAGARGVLHHAASERELRMALEVVGDGSVWAPRRVLSRLLDRAHGAPAAADRVKLTAREVEVLGLLVLGLPNREIAAAMGVELVTVKAHLGRLMLKAGVSNRTSLGVHALAARWVKDRI